MDEKKYIEMKQSFTEYLTEKKLRKTEERYAIFECICRFAGHFDMYSLQEVLEDGGLIVRHQLNAQSVQYELRALAETHLHLVCMKCGAIREMKDSVLKKEVNNLKISRFTQEFHALYIYGICSKCKFKLQQKNSKKEY